MNTKTTSTRQTGRAIGLGPSLMLAVTLIVLTSGGVNTARLIGSAGVSLAMTVLPERAVRHQQATPDIGDVSDPNGLRRDSVVFEGVAVARSSDCLLMARLGLIDLPPPAVL
ncbi:MAG: hypothetical protein KDA31_04570 [Phycisphaerales bacterium]|nr:hypothetical protein [Phycisphaerales bacterium]MCB9835705.1 hypothetical protein [Phycisphaera sp.]